MIKVVDALSSFCAAKHEICRNRVVYFESMSCGFHVMEIQDAWPTGVDVSGGKDQIA